MKSYIKNLKGLYIKYIAINLLIALIAFLITLATQKSFLSAKMNMYLSIIMMLCILFCFISGRKRYQHSLLKSRECKLEEKLNIYDKTNKKQLQSFTGITVVASIGFVLSYQPLYLIFAILATGLIAVNMPNKSRMRFELNLKQEEID